MATNKNPHADKLKFTPTKAEAYEGLKPTPHIMDEIGHWPMSRPIDANFVRQDWGDLPVMKKPEDEAHTSKGGE